MKIPLVRIGNSRGVRIPKAVIEQCGLGDEVEMTVRDRTLVIAPADGGRRGWDEAFKAMAAAGDDKPLLPDALDADADEAEWTW